MDIVGSEAADLTWVFVVGAVVLCLVLVIAYFVVRRVCRQRKLTKEVLKERKAGITKQWVQKRSLVPDLLRVVSGPAKSVKDSVIEEGPPSG